jgi:hypothetical protein
MHHLFALSCAFLCSPASLAAAAEVAASATTPSAQPAIDARPALAMLPVAAEGDLTKLTAVLDETLLTALRGTARFARVIGGSDLAAVLTLDQQRVLSGCDSPDCMRDFSTSLGVPFLCAPSVGTIGGHYVVSLKIIDTADARVLARVSRMVAAEVSLPAAVQTTAKQAVAMMFGEPVVLQQIEDPVVVAKRRRATVLRRTGLVLGLTGVALSAYAFAHAANNLDGLPPPGQQTTVGEVERFNGNAATADLLFGVGLALTTGGVASFVIGL